MRLNVFLRIAAPALAGCLAAAGCAGTVDKKEAPEQNETEDQTDETKSTETDEETSEESKPEIETEKYNRAFQKNVENLVEEFDHKGKEDFLGLRSPCEVLDPLLDRDGKFNMKMGVYIEMSGEFNVGPKLYLGGADVVLDLYHHQLTVSTFKGDGFVTSAGASTSVSFEAGFAHGFEQSANDWNGYFATVEFDFSLPFLKEFMEANAGTFVGASDKDDSGNIDGSDEVGEPGENVFGGYVGVSASAGFDPLLGASPVSAAAQRAFWKQHKEATKHLYDQLDGKIFKLFRIDARLVTPEGEPCPSGWPEENGDQGCVVEFGEDGESHVKRGLKTAGALCVLSAGCTAVPLTAPATIHALSVGAIRDSGAKLKNYCESDGWF